MDKNFSDIFNGDVKKLQLENEILKYLLNELLQIIKNKRNISNTYSNVLSNELNDILVRFKELEEIKRNEVNQRYYE